MSMSSFGVAPVVRSTTPSFMTPSPVAARSGSAHRLYGGRFDLVGQARFARPPPRIFVFVDVFLRERIDVRVGAVLGDAPHPAAQLDVAIGIVGIHDRERDRRALF